MGKRKGALLEENVENIFSSLSFETDKNVKKNGYEIDVLAKKLGFEIAIECKQYEKSNLTVRNLIHQWADKSQEIKTDRIILVLYGIDINETHKNLASIKNIVLWDENKLKEYRDLIQEDKEHAQKKLYSELNLETEEDAYVDYLKERYKKFLSKYLILGKNIDEYDKEELYGYFISDFKENLKSMFSQNKLENSYDNKKEFAEIFSEAEKITSNEEKWEKIKSLIKENSSLNPEVRVNVSNFARKVEKSFEVAKKDFDEKDKSKFRRKVIKNFIELLMEKIKPSSDLWSYCLKSSQNPTHEIFLEPHIKEVVEGFSIRTHDYIASAEEGEKLEWLFDEPESKEEFYYWNFGSDSNAITDFIEDFFKKFFEEDKSFNLFLDKRESMDSLEIFKKKKGKK